jgi:hypothetical protein
MIKYIVNVFTYIGKKIKQKEEGVKNLCTANISA